MKGLRVAACPLPPFTAVIATAGKPSLYFDPLPLWLRFLRKRTISDGSDIRRSDTIISRAALPMFGLSPEATISAQLLIRLYVVFRSDRRSEGNESLLRFSNHSLLDGRR